MTATIPLLEVDLLPGVDAVFTGRGEDADPPAVGRSGNLSHRRPHEPWRLARDRAEVAARMDLEPDDLHWMRQVHGAAVATITAETPRGAELRDVDALVTDQPGRALVVQVADCVPVLLASEAGPVAAVHAGRRGLHAGVVEAALDHCHELGGEASVRAAIGPAIGGCCYEVPAEMRDEVAAERPEAAAETTWGTPSLDLPRAVRTILERRGVEVEMVGSCTHCGDRWFSHRADHDAGRQLGVVVRRTPAG